MMFTDREARIKNRGSAFTYMGDLGLVQLGALGSVVNPPPHPGVVCRKIFRVILNSNLKFRAVLLNM